MGGGVGGAVGGGGARGVEEGARGRGSTRCLVSAEVARWLMLSAKLSATGNLS